METITKTCSVYSFDELSEEAKQTALDKWYENEDYPFLSYDLENEATNFDEYNIFENVKLCYSLSYCQGDGLSFDSDINIDNYLNAFTKLPEWKKKAIIEQCYKPHTSANTGHYCYCSKSDFNYDLNDTTKDYPLLNALIEDICKEITDYYLDICSKLEKSGYSIIEYRMNFEEFDEYCEANEYQFDINGNMI